MRKLLTLPAHALLDCLEAGEIGPADLFESQAAWARQADGQLNAFACFGPAEHSPEEPVLPAEGPRQYRHLPYGVSRILESYQPPYDATPVALLNAQHSLLLGKLNMDEFAMGSSGETCAWGATKNPWHFDYVPGGSSSGSAAAVAACQTPLALGTDTGGSIRQPASFCGVTGYRPTYGQISRYGMIAYSSSCDQCGVFARDALDCALAMNTLSRPDDLDSTCLAQGNTDFYAEAQREVHWSKLRVGVLKPFTAAERIAPAVLERYTAALAALTAQGAEVIELDFPLADDCLPAYYIITAAECSSNLARYDGIRFGPPPEASGLVERYVELRSRGFGAEVKRRILLGTYVLSAGYAGKFYDNARRLRGDIAAYFADAFTRVDVIATPTSPTLPFRFGDREADPVAMYLSDLCTVFVNLAGLCGISLPCGFGHGEQEAALPVGLQLACAPWGDALLLRLAWQYQRLTGYRYAPPQWVQDGLHG
jgi:aspartyl-tRNA(Asn)/glutamyl-tRNA(Gln) amidotransferase subunit A